ncbi:MAG: hypothetical protein A2081_05670 [Elusimicrobia bacterium GWC2_61_19]|nr:MAG: hypothetical protein A2081_05670 [Elusimicrobia bacterium GWC2_61_19]
MPYNKYMTASRKTALLALLLLTAPSLKAEADVKFGLPYPLEMSVAFGQKDGAVIYETPFSKKPAEDYDTVLVQGDMPDPAMQVNLTIKARNFFSAGADFKQTAFRRFPNGRFWAKYTVPLTRQPLKLRVLNTGARTGSRLAIYEAEIFVARAIKEAPAPQGPLPLVTEPAISVPETAPFKLVRRSGWQAQPPTQLYTWHEPYFFTLHHTQGNYPRTYEAAVSEVQFVQDYHQHAKGWIDIGYHFLVDPAGNIFEGRPILAEGAHVVKHNPGNIGISILGNYHPPVSNQFTPAAEASFVAVGRYLKDTYAVNVSSFYAHRDIGNTDCPGDDLYAKKTGLSALIFTPQDLPVPVNPTDAPPMTPAQQKSLDQLEKYLTQK